MDDPRAAAARETLALHFPGTDRDTIDAIVMVVYRHLDSLPAVPRGLHRRLQATVQDRELSNVSV
jgi:hypothetical protein